MALSKAYNPSEHEAETYKLWEDSGAFAPIGEGKPFSIIMPPPNANGDLHTGHAMFTVEDIMARYHRMQGERTLWLPGTDHAGIETQVVFERELAKQGKSRFDFSRERFYQETMAFTKANQNNILSQLKSLGFSADWNRLKFTLDEDIIKIVYTTFKQMHQDGLVYRANRIVNWCTRCNASFSDIELKHQERIDPLYYVKYGPFVVATVRPEPMFADTAIAVNPKDERYQEWIGKTVEVELLWGKHELPVIGDEHVDPDFGTGVIKVTPAHDPNDWDMAQRHNLEVIQGIGTDGRLTAAAGRYAGMSVDDGRSQIAHDLEEQGLIDHIEMDYKHSVAIHDRDGTVIEPLVTEQWWVKVEALKAAAIKALKDDQINFYPVRFKKITLDWLDNLRDWNISRQIAWGIPIPIYYNSGSDQTKDDYIVAETEAEAEAYFGKGNYEAEIDTFDTWFSSSQWPYATLMATGDFDDYYPTSVMATGREILFLWVSRMIMMSLYRTKQIPFHDVYIWGYVTDAQGKKMSKSKGNVINPLEFTAKYGTDALRLALTIGITPGLGGALSEQKVEGYRNFCNKLWNVARFILEKAEGYSPTLPEPKSLADRWIMTRLAETTTTVTKELDEFNFSAAGQAIYALLWDDFADWYLEASKTEANLGVLVYGLETILKMLHPIAPFVTEAIWQNMAWQKQNLIVVQWPTPGESFEDESKQFEGIQSVIRDVRKLQKELGISKIELLTNEPTLLDNATLLESVIKATVVKGQGSGLILTDSKLNAWLQVDDTMIQKYVQTLKHKRDEQKSRGVRASTLLDNPGFSAGATNEAKQLQHDIAVEADLLTSKLDEQIAKISQT